MRLVAPALCVLGALASPLAARAGEAGLLLEAARGEATKLRFDAALDLASKGLQVGDASPHELAELWFIAGKMLAVMDRASEAEDAFGRALELRPDLLLPPGSSPKIVDPFERVRRRLGGAHLTARARSKLQGRQVCTTMRLEGDVFGLVQTARLLPATPGDASYPLVAGDPWQVNWPCEHPPCGYRLVLSDTAGNRVLEVGAAAALLFVDAQAPEAATASPSAADPVARPWYARPLPYAVGGAVLAVAAGALTWRFLDTQQRLKAVERDPSQTWYQDAVQLDASRQQLHPWMLAAWAAAGAGGAGALTLALW